MRTLRLSAASFVLVALSFSAHASVGEGMRALEGGSRARVVRPEGLELPSSAQEWEAFLSLDGGRHYTMRITPHLSLAVRSFEWQVPDLPTSDARILIRVGDEAVERAFEVPGSFSIRASTTTTGRAILSPQGSSRARGEPARPGDAGVMTWVDGTRSGDGAVTVSASIPIIAPAETTLRTPLDLPAASALPVPATTGLAAVAERVSDRPATRFPIPLEPLTPAARLLFRTGRLNI
ncbi:MAG TPA: hypothetical protein VHL58_11835 [Thermoanaerobaculia bacterium]|nr:hypothetical protein [Thermoanaerobaculia bacterium]